LSSSHGIGYEVARQLAQRGMTVVLTARDDARGTTAATQLNDAGLDVRFMTLNIADDASVQQAATQLAQDFSHLDVLVNNAATNFDYGDTVLEVDLAQVRETFETNLLGTWRVTRAFLPLLRRSAHGRIVNVGSGAGTFGAPEGMLANFVPNLPAYTLSKLALNGLTLKMAAELQGTGILVNSVCPGTTASSPEMESIPGARPVEQGAVSIVWAALLPDDGPTGGFFRDGQPLPW
jgi:NAD(P)-dependent dehydrogenase (short-subunit alcohol dehydrogenase family)